MALALSNCVSESFNHWSLHQVFLSAFRILYDVLVEKYMRHENETVMYIDGLK